MKLCVSIACGSHTRMIAEHAKLAADGVKMVELRLDFLRKAPDFKRLLESRPSATVIAVRRTIDGGQWNAPEPQRLVILRAAIAAGVEIIDLEVDIARSIPRFGSTKRLVSYHNTKGMPVDLAALVALHRDMRECDPDAIKIAVTPKSFGDLHRFLAFISDCNKIDTNSKPIPTIGIAMGELGVASRLLAGKYGMPMTYATFSASRIIAPGLMTYQKMRDAFRCESITPETEVFGIIGDPITHSLSPAIHNASYVEAQMNRIYLPFRVQPSEIKQFIAVAPSLGIRGLSVTIPHKQAVLEYLTHPDEAVEAIGACNTVLFQGDERFGFNTDYLAAVLAIVRANGGHGNETPSVLSGRRALILGAGGAGHALAYGLHEHGVYCTITDQDAERAQSLANTINSDWCPWNTRHDFQGDILVNCTPIGMHPHINATPYSHRSLRRGMTVFDAVYNPENTLLVKEARQHDCAVVTGVEMFVGQAMLQFRLFTGQNASSTLMRSVLKRELTLHDETQ